MSIFFWIENKLLINDSWVIKFVMHKFGLKIKRMINMD